MNVSGLVAVRAGMVEGPRPILQLLVGILVDFFDRRVSEEAAGTGSAILLVVLGPDLAALRALVCAVARLPVER